MSHKAAKIGVTTLVLATAFGVLLYTTLGESMQYYKYVDEVVAKPDRLERQEAAGARLRRAGLHRKKRDALEYRFDIQRNGKTMRAFYTGIVPDTFKDDSEVVLTGVLTKEGFMADGHDGEVPVEVRGGSRPRRQPLERARHGIPGLLPAAGRVRRRRVRRGDLGGRRAPPLDAR